MQVSLMSLIPEVRARLNPARGLLQTCETSQQIADQESSGDGCDGPRANRRAGRFGDLRRYFLRLRRNRRCPFGSRCCGAGCAVDGAMRRSADAIDLSSGLVDDLACGSMSRLRYVFNGGAGRVRIGIETVAADEAAADWGGTFHTVSFRRIARHVIG